MPAMPCITCRSWIWPQKTDVSHAQQDATSRHDWQWPLVDSLLNTSSVPYFNMLPS